ncbi:MAG: class I SAM-dependent methyltransferase [Bacteroidota bacterium]
MSKLPIAVATETRPPYSVLAAVYDVVMEHVDYDLWAEYVHELLQMHRHPFKSVVELGSGTGSFAFAFQEWGPYDFVGIDVSAQMTEVARRKAELFNAEVQFEVADFTNFRLERPVDFAVLLYDGLNYLLLDEQVGDLFRCVHAALKPGSLFLFDQSTPANSINNAEFFEDEGEAEGVSYIRKSYYDAETRLHTTAFDIAVGDQQFNEVHVERAYTLDEMLALIEDSPFRLEAHYDGFSQDPADAETERIHWLLRA